MPTLKDVPAQCADCPFFGKGIFFADIEIPVCLHPQGFKRGEPLCVMANDPPPEEQCPLVKVKRAYEKRWAGARWWAWRKVTRQAPCVAKQP